MQPAADANRAQRACGGGGPSPVQAGEARIETPVYNVSGLLSANRPCISNLRRRKLLTLMYDLSLFKLSTSAWFCIALLRTHDVLCFVKHDSYL
jgi:hypothetical protein